MARSAGGVRLNVDSGAHLPQPSGRVCVYKLPHASLCRVPLPLNVSLHSPQHLGARGLERPRQVLRAGAVCVQRALLRFPQLVRHAARLGVGARSAGEGQAGGGGAGSSGRAGRVWQGLDAVGVRLATPGVCRGDMLWRTRRCATAVSRGCSHEGVCGFQSGRLTVAQQTHETTGGVMAAGQPASLRRPAGGGAGCLPAQ